MARKKIEVVKAEVVETPEVIDEHVVFHLDRDPNDVRNYPPTQKLPSLND